MDWIYPLLGLFKILPSVLNSKAIVLQPEETLISLTPLEPDALTLLICKTSQQFSLWL